MCCVGVQPEISAPRAGKGWNENADRSLASWEWKSNETVISLAKYQPLWSTCFQQLPNNGLNGAISIGFDVLSMGQCFFLKHLRLQGRTVLIAHIVDVFSPQFSNQIT